MCDMTAAASAATAPQSDVAESPGLKPKRVALSCVLGLRGRPELCGRAGGLGSTLALWWGEGRSSFTDCGWGLAWLCWGWGKGWPGAVPQTPLCPALVVCPPPQQEVLPPACPHSEIPECAWEGRHAAGLHPGMWWPPYGSGSSSRFTQTLCSYLQNLGLGQGSGWSCVFPALGA